MLIERGDITLDVRDSGTGPPVVLLHGWPDTKDVWRHQIPALLAAGYRVITPDLRGFGASSRPTAVDAYTAPTMVGDLLGVLDSLAIDRAHLVGHDWGAAIAWMTAALAPDRVASLTALSVGHPAAFRAAGLRQREKSWYMLLFQFPGIAEQWLRADDFRNLREFSSHPDIDRVVERLAEPDALTASLNVYRAILPPTSLIEPQVALPRVQAPVMGVWSSGDRALTEEAMTGSAAHIAGPWRYEHLDSVGHWMQLDAPQVLNALLLDFLNHRDATSAPTTQSSRDVLAGSTTTQPGG
ncbi:alpha/beta fold hydrolase [Phytohabitans rumicis]|uniref:Alpha/beta hydrolase n=1 Tax=Phytohabitans rumicis TaxID=1076125 RepID=A0A6V8L0T3_9ACTN|nr:alpha/beta fold hydrolase [Phytohabitans rumicis]GFJ87696.1 alpha/beta hydrolase [Phytohabitans rumicis]